MTMYDAYLGMMDNLINKAKYYGLSVELDDSSYPFKVVFCYTDPDQVSLFDGRKTGTMIVTVWPTSSRVDLNLLGIDRKDLTHLVTYAEKTVLYYLHALAEGSVPV